MNYAEAKQIANELNEASKVSGDILDQFPKGAMGLTLDSVRATPEWKLANAKFASDFAKLRTFNAFYVKAFKKERNAERAAKYANLTN